MKIIVSIFLFMSTMLAFSQQSVPDKLSGLPTIEMNYGQSRDWIGHKFRDIIPSAEIDRIIVLTHASSGLKNEILTQSDYRDLISHLLASDDEASGGGLRAQEWTGSTLIITTKNGQIYFIEILNAVGISAVTIKGPGKGARFELEGYKVKSYQK